jgi:hypothetical protein
MNEQNFKNHTQLVPGFHYVTLPLLLVIFIGSLVNLFKCEDDDWLMASILCLISFALVLLAWYARAFALRAQDRAIRAEENFRHFLLTGKPLPTGLRVSQIIALRFAADDSILASSAADTSTSSRLASGCNRPNIARKLRIWK